MDLDQGYWIQVLRYTHLREKGQICLFKEESRSVCLWRKNGAFLVEGGCKFY
jgi:hypothetical protein